ncbi:MULTISPECIES: SpaH/EbpB family LPXTG-anchored major pilin [Bifidobacterium]|jgi:fimbrial isopeptide formation D2 family protein/LPXTG-motif cell wall-anchored protein|uniref:SpaH/EbpB family LPXTG-anchored major pilin n=1 Tax=Bifidobacterium TaxID=1678 RepID=UPI0023535A0D|nr:SpaH/EbpB family LPXTG-anchored major pilin [Bifidobacterium tibiigranuli]MCI1212137.1 SpaH/EbpB family LPXTG-anchored major pilin [Bifidobacterium tibiigranuli]MCI1221905.1 SpaH/EbpB family LPXTG-anchored major pilin [Bifidobacterium tibiigranuli]MCI1232759.1 SpaH/EbpB family LPXTG-anchored major pilin [Bifidobacterium tibiigranuli]MCI1792156.1 SpaH/EbpB family LPXTG-anchored major pilin [Bifidobacterium tibiigranuli]
MTQAGKASLARRLAAVAGALAVGIMGLAGASMTANATDDIPVTGVGNIVPAEKTSLTIHKYDGNPSQKPGDGSELNDVSALGNPLKGVEFTITPVASKGAAAIDLDTPGGWDLIDGIKATDVTAAGSVYKLGSPATVVTTDESGVGKLADGTVPVLPHGLYLVTETGYGDNVIKTEAAPFLVTLPLPQGNGKWLYKVHAYPKNVVDTNVPTKEVKDPTDGRVTIGSTVPWTIKAPVQPSKPGTITSFVISDKLDPRLTFKDLSIEGFTKDTDYTVAVDNATNTVTITFVTGQPGVGVKKLKAGDLVTVTLNTTVTSLGNGVIPNEALVFTNDGKGKPTTKPTTNWGPLEVLKYAKGDPAKTLAGAEFTVYSDEAATKIVGTFVTGADGKGSIALFVGNNDDVSQDYWIKETKAPAGYVLDATVRKVTVKAGATATQPYGVENVQQGHPNLPLTGASGTVAMTLGGLTLVLVGAGAYVLARKRSAR